MLTKNLHTFFADIFSNYKLTIYILLVLFWLIEKTKIIRFQHLNKVCKNICSLLNIKNNEIIKEQQSLF